jgi:hypothetical protein
MCWKGDATAVDLVLVLSLNIRESCRVTTKRCYVTFLISWAIFPTYDIETRRIKMCWKGDDDVVDLVLVLSPVHS